MFGPEDGLLRHVTGQPAPLLLHVPPRRTAYRHKWPARRRRQCYMFLPGAPPPGDEKTIAWKTPELAPLERRIRIDQ